MLFKGISKRYKHIKRYRRIVEVLIKHGFGYLIEIMDLYQFVPLRKRIKKLNPSDKPKDCRARRIRNVLEELGPTFIKLGQLLSTRADLIPPRYIEELEKLQDQVPPMDYKEVILQLEEELNTDYRDYFEEISTKPLASASIGQVHEAILSTGEKVVIKVQRREIEGIIENDLEIMSNLASILENRVFTDNFISPQEIVDNFSNVIKQELDYRIESRNARKFSRNFANDEDVKIAKIFWDLTTRRVLTMEYIAGKRINYLQDGSRTRKLAKLISKSFMKQVLLDGFFHGDPHPGNIIITTDYKLALIDFGQVGRLTRDDRERIASLFISLVNKNVEKAIDELLYLGVVTADIDKKSLKRDFNRLLEDYYGAALGDLELTPVVNRILELSFRYKIKLPIEFILLIKSLVTIEGVVAKIDPKFDILTVAKPFVYDIIKERLSPKRLLKDSRDKVGELSKTLSELPKGLHKLFKIIEEGNLEFKIHHFGIKELISKLDIITNRISISLIVSALIVGSSLIMLTDKGSTFLGYPIVGVSGYLIAALLGIWLVISILRSGRF